MTNRAERARERAGLSLAQAARMLGCTVDKLTEIENLEFAYAVCEREALADAYGVSVEWLDGTSPLRDYARLKNVPGYDELSFHDRDELAEFIASIPRRQA